MTAPVQDPIPLFKLLEPDLLERLMKRTGSGAAVNIRELATAAGLPHGTVGNLLTGEQESVIAPSAFAICAVIGVDLPILFAPLGRSVKHTGRRRVGVSA